MGRWADGRNLWWHDTGDAASPEHTPEAFDSGHRLFLLYTSGTTGKPKGIVHTTGGYLTQTSYTHHNVFDVKHPTVTCSGAPPTSAESPGQAVAVDAALRLG